MNSAFADVTRYCRESLGKRGSAYLADREVSRESIEEWGLGYCPFELDGLVTCTDDLEGMLDSKLLFEKKDSNDYGSFIRNSISFPFYNEYNHIVAISFRPIITEEKRKALKLSKYWHTSFSKNSFLYGLNKAIPHIRKVDQVIVAEGQFDVITAHQHGIKNTVGVCGTALTDWHTSILARYVYEIILVFDGDEAGENSRNKIIRDKREKYLELMKASCDRHDACIKAVILPAGEDLDSYVRSFGKNGLLELIEKAS